MLEFAAMNTFKLEWLLVYLYESLLFLWLYRPLAVPFPELPLLKKILLPFLPVLYVLAKWRWENYILPNILVMILYGILVLRLFTEVNRRNILWLAGVFTVCIELGRIVVYGSLYITGNVELYNYHHWLLRILALLIKCVLIRLCRKPVCEYAKRKVEALDYLLIFLAITQLIFMHQRRRISIANPENIRFEVETFLTLGLGVLIILVSLLYHMNLVMKEEHLQKIRSAMDDTYREAQRRRDIDKETHRLYHDLKHQLQAIGSLEPYDSKEARGELIQELFQHVQDLEDPINSGNPLLDSLLRQKLRLAREKNIRIELYLEPNSYDYLDKMDLCSFFGNALDNAIEAASLIEDSKKRWIRVKSTVIQGVWVMKSENNYCVAPTVKNGVFLTGKADAAHHGIGISSMQYCAEKYGGKLNFQTGNGIFSLLLTIPLP